MADPRIIDPIDVLSEIDQRPNLLDLNGYGFEHFIQNLFSKMNLEVKIFKPGGDGGIDCVVYDQTAVFGGKYVIQAKRYAKTVPSVRCARSLRNDAVGRSNQGLAHHHRRLRTVELRLCQQQATSSHLRYRAAWTLPRVRNPGSDCPEDISTQGQVETSAR